ncbi:MAG TPA: hypothetical protein VH854_15300 [Thermoanaerobaculia bacterium]|jgi:hypothetical protein|nr:hypothetical protein [Thermoanaerobaculia bacterium]
MFLGHFGLAFAGKRIAPYVSLGSLFLAVQFADLLFFLLTLLGTEHFRISPGATRVTPMDFYDYPYSHSLLGLVVWGVLIGAIYWVARRALAGGVLLAAGVVSHWVLDVIVHRRDMPLGLQGPYYGLDLWGSLPLTLAVEAVVFGAGIAIYLAATRPRDLVGVWAFWALVAFLTVSWLGSVLGPPPPSERAVEWIGLAMWLLVPWGWWIDRHRELARAAAAAR